MKKVDREWENIPVSEEHGDIHGTHEEDDMEPGVLYNV